MTISIIGTALFVALILLIIAGELKQRREWDKQKRDLKRENMVRRNAEQDAEFHIELNRSVFFWHICQWLYGVE